MSNDVTVNIGGNTYKLQEALEAGARAIDGFGREVAGSVERTNSALAAATAYYRRMTQELNYLRDASRVMGEETANANVEWLRAAAGSSEYGDRLAYLKSQLGLLNAEQREAQSQSGTLGSALNDNVFSRFGAWNMELSAVIANFRTLSSVVMAVPNALGRLGQLGFQYAQQGVQQSFSLAEQTEKNFVNWAFLWGGVNTTEGTPGYGTGPGVAPAAELMRWSKQASLRMPWTRQDLMAAITTLSGEPGQNIDDVEKHLTLVSDLAATQGRPGITLNWAAMAAMRGDQGQRRMLLYELKLTPEELANYGYDESDNSTFYPALEKYAKSRGSFGASDFISKNTFWGAWTSAIDRVQNFGLSVAGMKDNPDSLTGDVREGSFFWRLKKDLAGLSSWADDANNQAAIGKVADLIQNVLGGGATLAGGAVQGLLDGLQRTGAEQFLFDTVSNVAQWLSSPDTAKGAQKIGDALGGLLGPAGQTGAKAIEGILDGLKESGVGDTLLKTVKDLGVWFSDPQHQKDVQEFFKEMGDAAGDAVKALDKLLTKLGDIGTWLGQQGKSLESGSTPVLSGIGEWFGQRMVDGLTPEQQALLASQNPFAPPKDWKHDKHMWEGYVEQAEWDVLMRQYDGDPQKVSDAFAAWLKQEQSDVSLETAQPGNGGANVQNPGRAAQLAHRGLAALASGGGSGSGGTSTTNDAYTEAGQMAGHQYLAAFKTTMDTQGPATMASAVASYTTGLHAQLKDAGSTLARDLSDYVQQAVQQGIADALRNARISGNADLRQPGAFRSGGIGLGGAL